MHRQPRHGHDTLFGGGKHSGEILSRSNLAVRSDKDLSYVKKYGLDL